MYQDDGLTSFCASKRGRLSDLQRHQIELLKKSLANAK